ncbi:Rrf2 family transcriptional regulator [[Mycoplasma] testudinis]|uniref:Rrf2 family transcriptional regulator n=1 Tax=[Mycoplasma] testudinis TaxID=33924 RepID=UPI0004835574|nr:Rrf2 family transcriptional regulator [[Mycoplasma] testudinis]
MKVNSQYALAVHIMLMIAYFHDKKMTSELLAESAGCNPVIIRKTYAKLKSAKLLVTKSGKGITKLALPPNKITMWDIFSAVEIKEVKDILKTYENKTTENSIGGEIRKLITMHFEKSFEKMKQRMSTITLNNLLEKLKLIENHKKSEEELNS